MTGRRSTAFLDGSCIDGRGARGIWIAQRTINLFTALRPARISSMEIRFVSSLTSEDEARLAAAIFAASTRLLEQFEIAYTLRIDTLDGQSLRHTSEGPPPVEAADVLAAVEAQIAHT
jgi:hypothetical protein